MLVALRGAFARKLRGQVLGDLFQLWREVFWQFVAQRFRGCRVGSLRVLVGLLLDFLHQPRGFRGHFLARRGKFLLPLFECRVLLRRHSLVRRFARRRLYLLLGVGHQPRQLSRQLQRRVRCAGRGRERSQVIAHHHRSALTLVARDYLVFHLIWLTFQSGPQAMVLLLNFRKCEPVLGRKRNAPGISRRFQL